jgi:hypothetical protein
MPARNLTFLMLALVVLAVALAPGSAFAQDAQICFDAADKVTDGGTLQDAERQAAHAACQRALARPRAWCRNISYRKRIST